MNTMRSGTKIVDHASIIILAFYLVGCGTSDQSEKSNNSNETLPSSSLPPDEGSNNASSDQSGMEISQPIDIGFWKETDERLVMYYYEMNRGDSGQYSEIKEINRSQISAEKLELLSIAKSEVISPESLYAMENPLNDSPTIERASSGLVECLPEISTFDGFHIFTSSGAAGSSTTVASSISCGPIDLFSRSDIRGTLDPVLMKSIFTAQ